MRKRTKFLFIFSLVVLLLGILFYLYSLSALKKLDIKGNTYYSDEEILRIITGGKKYDNTLQLYIKLKYGEKVKAPFINELDVDLIGLNRLYIRIFEKDIVGAFPYMGEYVCFDKDGIMVGSITEKREDVPIIEGIIYKKAVFNEVMDTNRPELFDVILNLTQLIKKYQVSIQKIKFDKEMRVVLESGKIKINLGKRTHFDEQISNLPVILSKTKGMEGVLKMEDYSVGNQKVIFEGK